MTTLGLVVEVVKRPAQTLIEDGGAAQRQRVIPANGEASGVDGACLRRSIELKLAIGSHVTDPVEGIMQHSVVESDDESPLIPATEDTLLIWLAYLVLRGTRESEDVPVPNSVPVKLPVWPGWKHWQWL